MAQNQLPISNVVNISLAQSPTGLGQYNTSNVALFTRESPGATFGSGAYALYLSPTQVGIDFGTSSATYAMANAVFSQQPNILANGGYLAIFPFLSTAQTAVQNIALSGIPASGAFVLRYNGNSTSSLPYTSSASAIATALNGLTGLGTVTVTGSLASQNLVVTFTGVSGAAPLLTLPTNTLATASSAAITATVTTTTIGSAAETLDQAITRTTNTIQYFGIMAAEVEIQTVSLAAAAVVQALNKLLFLVSFTSADIAPGGTLDLIRSGGFTQTRCLYYGDVLATALVMMASYVGRGLSTNFNGSNTTSTMHLKQLVGVQPDPSMTQTLLTTALIAGADTYVSLMGVNAVFCSGANGFFDDQYNEQWFVGAMQVAGFNALQQTSTKLPQTESGVNILKSAYRAVCQQGVTNQFLAPGAWTSSTTFGNQADLITNVAQLGYYIYSVPVSQQSPSARATRAAPLIQVAIKLAGAIQSSSLIINVNL